MDEKLFVDAVLQVSQSGIKCLGLSQGLPGKGAVLLRLRWLKGVALQFARDVPEGSGAVAAKE